MRRAPRHTKAARVLHDPFVLELACTAYLFGMSGDQFGVHHTLELARVSGIAPAQVLDALDTIAGLPTRTEESLDALVTNHYARDARARAFASLPAGAKSRTPQAKAAIPSNDQPMIPTAVSA